jgi:hypothetical protein
MLGLGLRMRPDISQARPIERLMAISFIPTAEYRKPPDIARGDPGLHAIHTQEKSVGPTAA